MFLRYILQQNFLSLIKGSNMYLPSGGIAATRSELTATFQSCRQMFHIYL